MAFKLEILAIGALLAMALDAVSQAGNRKGNVTVIFGEEERAIRLFRDSEMHSNPQGTTRPQAAFAGAKR